MPVSDGAPPSEVVATVLLVVIFGMLIVMPAAGMARVPPQASMTGREPMLTWTTLRS